MKARLEIGFVEITIELFKAEFEDVVCKIPLVTRGEQNRIIEGDVTTILNDLRDELETELVIQLADEGRTLRSTAKSRSEYAANALKSADEFDAELEKITENIAKEHREALKEDMDEG